jgi:phosphonate transport system permease protein
VPPLPAKASGGRSRLYAILAALALLALLIAAWINVQASLTTLWHGTFGARGLIRDVLPHSVPPDMSQFWTGVKAAWTTLAIAVLSIVFGVFWSVLLLPLGARNITPSRVAYELTRLLLAVFRAIPELILLLMFNVVLGFTPFAAVLALTIHGVSVKGKLFAEAVEEMDMAPVDALRVAGAGRLQVFLHAVLPGVRNTLVGLTLYRLDGNFRSAVTLGAVGAGGIGFNIFNSLQTFQYKQVCTFLIVLVLVVMAIERVSTILRARLT